MAESRERHFRIGQVDEFVFWHKATRRTPRKRKKAIKAKGKTEPFTAIIEAWLGNDD